jgi:hypothetical protein
MSGATLIFYQSGTLVPAAIYANSTLTNQFNSTISSDAAGRFPVIYLDETQAYRRQLYDQYGQLLSDVDPINTSNSIGITYSSIKAVTTSQVSNTTITAEPKLTLNVTLTGIYTVSGSWTYIPGPGGFTFQLSLAPADPSALPSPPLLYYGYSQNSPFISPSAGGVLVNANPNVPISWDLGGSTQSGLVSLGGIVHITGPAVFGLAWAQKTSNAAVTTLGPGYISLTKIV